ncbi:MAG TPA: ABC transporter permease, partial [Bryobacteraceae bacterium]|nr:ABC transporter permease [Bryobacteraceae bacterium]
MFELFVARRYLRAKRKQVVISVITVISVIGVAAGVMALVIALAINNGFRNTLERDLLSATAPVSIREKEQGPGIDGWEQIAQKLAKLPHVTSAAPGLYETGLLSGPVNSEGVVVKGIRTGAGAPLVDTLRHLKSGSIEGLKSQPGERPGIILGAALADNLGAVLGKPVQLIIPNGELTPFGAQPSFVRVRVAGIFESGYYDEDANWAFMSLEDTQKAFDVGDVVNTIELRLDDIYQAPQVAS